jgi:sporulation protein YlmC with PRC-barrel domain
MSAVRRTRIQSDALTKTRNRFATAGAILLVAAAVLISPEISYAQVAGSRTVGVTKEEVKELTRGWSAKKQIMGKTVYNEDKESIGTVDDLIITPAKSVSYAIIGVGGFLGMGKHDVAIPVNHFKVDKDRITLPGATKDALKAMPEFEYPK